MQKMIQDARTWNAGAEGTCCEKLLKRINSKSEFVLTYQAISCMSVKVSERNALCCEMSKQQNQSQQSGSFCFVFNFGSNEWSHLAKCCQGTQHAWRNLGHHLPDHVLRSWGGRWVYLVYLAMPLRPLPLKTCSEWSYTSSTVVLHLRMICLMQR